MVYPPESRSLKNTERNLLPSHLTGVLCRPQCPSAGALPEWYPVLIQIAALQNWSLSYTINICIIV